MKRYLLLLPTIAALAACVPPPPHHSSPDRPPHHRPDHKPDQRPDHKPGHRPDQKPQRCQAGALSHLVGTPLSTFNTGSIKGPVRVLAPGSMMTMDHRPDRVNIYHNRRGVIEKVTCG